MGFVCISQALQAVVGVQVANTQQQHCIAHLVSMVCLVQVPILICRWCLLHGCQMAPKEGCTAAGQRWVLNPADPTSTGSLNAATGSLDQPATKLVQWVTACPAAGPHIDWSPGRSDKIDGSACPEDGRLPDASKGAPHIRDVFNRMGFNDREIVALSGGIQSYATSFAPNSLYTAPFRR